MVCTFLYFTDELNLFYLSNIPNPITVLCLEEMSCFPPVAGLPLQNP